MREGSASISLDPADTSHWGHDGKTYIIGQNDATFSGGGLYDGSIGGIEEYMEEIIAAETAGGAGSPLTFAPEGLSSIGAICILGSAKTTSYEVNPVISDVVTMSFEVQADGGMWGGQLLFLPTAITSSTNGTSIDNVDPTSAFGVTVHAHILSNANTGNVTVTLQHSTNNSTWVDLAILPVVTTGTTSAVRSATVAGTVNRYLRITVTLAGTGAVSVAAAVARK